MADRMRDGGGTKVDPAEQAEERFERGRRTIGRSGMLPITRMVKTGAVFDVIGAILCVVGVAVMARVVGLV
jgi:hypothetical protein